MQSECNTLYTLYSQLTGVSVLLFVSQHVVRLVLPSVTADIELKAFSPIHNKNLTTKPCRYCSTKPSSLIYALRFARHVVTTAIYSWSKSRSNELSARNQRRQVHWIRFCKPLETVCKLLPYLIGGAAGSDDRFPIAQTTINHDFVYLSRATLELDYQQ